MKIEDSLDREQLSYNLSGQYSSQTSKQAMQILYKQQLDTLLIEKTRQKEAERQRELAQKKQFNQRALNNKQSQKVKQLAYKNYYNMLLNNQQQLQGSYVSPFSFRDSLKDQHIINSVQQGQKKMKQYQLQERKRQADRKSMYRSQLMNQMEQRKKMQIFNKEEEQRKKQQYRKYGRLPQQITSYEKKKHMDQMNKYKQDLDKFKQDKDTMARSRALSQKQKMSMISDHHDTLINPLPYNIQNPYILRQMNKQNYVFSRGNINQSPNNN